MTKHRYDLIVAGGGIHGLMIALFAAEAGRRTLLLDKGEIGAATTAGWFGILHGGLRYLQSLDVRRFRQSLSDSRWFAQNFPDFVCRQSFLMPLFGQGLKRPEAFRIAFLLDRLLGPDRNRDVPEAYVLPKGRVLSSADVISACPAIPQTSLSGGALWEELIVPDGQALINALLDRARVAGLDIRPSTEMTALHTSEGRVTGVTAGLEEFSAPVVVNAAGAWSSEVAGRCDPRAAPLAYPALAFNVLIDRPPPSVHGLSLLPSDPAGSMVFLYPSRGRIFAGTSYLPFDEPADTAAVPQPAIRTFLDQLNAAVPSLAMEESDILEVTSGLLPATSPNSVDLMDRDVIRVHGNLGGPQGLVSLWGVKYTTAPSVARRVLATLDLTP